MVSLSKYRLKPKELGVTLAELLVALLVMGVIMVIPAIIAKKALSQENTQNCENPSDITKDLVKYVEEYNINNPSNKLGDFTIIAPGIYESETHPQQENDPKFSLLVSKIVCTPYKFDSIDGGHFTIKTGKSLSESPSTSNDEWVKVYDSRQQ